MHKPQQILTLTSTEVLDYFLKSEQYHNFELPEYFEFDSLLQHIKQTMGDISYDDCLSNTLPDDLRDVNLDILLNKDGRYAVRPIVLVNPYLYYFLAREISSNWDNIKVCFDKFQVPHITSCAIPVIPNKKEPFHKSTTILNWWNTIEQRSLELSLEYRYMFITDITNCYGSVNPQTIDWALSLKATEQPINTNHQLANNIIRYLKAMQQGRNIGIPQGSVLFDFVGEIILGYSDLLLSNKLKQKGIIDGYEILRYRDDYRIFCNDIDLLEQISYILQEVLESLNFRMNSQKTKISHSLITDSIKSDKLWYIENTPIFNKKGVDFDGIQKHLLYILLFGRKYPNGGQLRVMLNDLDRRIEERLKPNAEGKKGKILENMRPMCAIAAQIAIENVNVSHYALRIISRLTNSIKDDLEHWDIIEKVYQKLRNRPNSLYDQLWLQNITYQKDKKAGTSPYDFRLCKLVMGESDNLWNNTWIKPELYAELPLDTICNQETLAKVTPVITFRESRAYNEIIEIEDIELFENEY